MRRFWPGGGACVELERAAASVRELRPEPECRTPCRLLTAGGRRGAFKVYVLRSTLLGLLTPTSILPPARNFSNELTCKTSIPRVWVRAALTRLPSVRCCCWPRLSARGDTARCGERRSPHSFDGSTAWPLRAPLQRRSGAATVSMHLLSSWIACCNRSVGHFRRAYRHCHRSCDEDPWPQRDEPDGRSAVRRSASSTTGQMNSVA